ncbi:hypothetical protein Daus18300_005293 [Diaporthe australafricana]|uniref:Protein-tyrosine-phosphatase n=1 Tax=Diaporthe australafricana TaxID=127596 RepID=A0ABR3X2Q3_9PEZI
MHFNSVLYSMTDPLKDVSVDEIVPGLFLGNMACVESEKVLTELEITAVVSVVSERRRPFPQTSTSYGLLGRRRPHTLEKLFGIENRLVIFADDRSSDNIFRHFDSACHFIDHRLHPTSVSDRNTLDTKALGEQSSANSHVFKKDTVKKSGRVLVHCTRGKSRSATIVAAYMMWKWDLCVYDALQHVQNRRSIALPNEGFMDQLFVWEKLECISWISRRFHIRPRAYYGLKHRLGIYKRVREVRAAIERASKDEESTEKRPTEVSQWALEGIVEE